MSSTTADQDEWLVARAGLLDAEKELTRAADAIAAQRRALPRLAIESDYRFATNAGEQTLLELFGGRRQLVVYHFMFGPDWDEGCPICSFWADSYEGIGAHLQARDTTLTCISPAPLAKLDAYRKRLGWTFNWVSSEPSDFSADMGFSPNAHRPNPMRPCTEEQPGLSVFEADGDRVFLTYQTTARGLEPFNAAYGMLDLTPLGRDEDDLPFTMAWVRRNDSYGEQQS